MPADYDGDGLIDLAVFRPGSANWYIVYSSNGASAVIQWGLSSDQPFARDFDGDGRADLAVYRPCERPVVPAVEHHRVRPDHHQGVGPAGDLPVPADFDGDGRTEISIFRPSNGEWVGIDALTAGLVINRQWGLNGDIAVPHDYDGDGVTDPAVFRGNGYWFIRQSSNGALLQVSWGLAGDDPRGPHPRGEAPRVLTPARV